MIGWPLPATTLAFSASALLVAQGADSLAGTSGWAGAGILGLVLSWLLLKHLPDKDRQVKVLADINRAVEKGEMTKILREIAKAGMHDQGMVNSLNDLHRKGGPP